MRFNRKKRASGTVEVVVTSLLDINFLLIMFFMMAAQFQRESRAPLNLPQEQGEAEPKPDESGIVININADGEIIISDKIVSLEKLSSIVAEERDKVREDSNQPLKLLVRVDRNASTTDLNTVVQLLRTAGVGVVRVATVQPKH